MFSKISASYESTMGRVNNYLEKAKALPKSEKIATISAIAFAVLSTVSLFVSFGVSTTSLIAASLASTLVEVALHSYANRSGEPTPPNGDESK